MYLVNQKLFKTVQLKIKQKNPTFPAVIVQATPLPRIRIIPLGTPREGDPERVPVGGFITGPSLQRDRNTSHLMIKLWILPLSPDCQMSFRRQLTCTQWYSAITAIPIFQLFGGLSPIIWGPQTGFLVVCLMHMANLFRSVLEEWDQVHIDVHLQWQYTRYSIL